MNELIKIRDVSSKYDISARTLRYYEDMGLINSTRSDDYAYRMYDETAVKRLEQILILRKLNISIKDIQRIFNTSGSEVVLEVLGKKVDDIDGEVSLLHELKEIVLEFIHQIENADFGKDSDVKLLYEKAKEIETQLVNVDYNGNPSNVNRLIDVTEKIKKAPEVRVVEIPKCRMATSGFDTFDKTLNKFCDWWDEYGKKRKGAYYAPSDFMWHENGQAVWWVMVEDWAISEDCGGYDIIDFEGGLYAAAISIDGDDDINGRVYQGIKNWIEISGFESDERPGHQTLCHMPNPTEEIKKGLGYHQLDIFVPIKLREEK
jgi:DNA-binding transcriptional MerR regulator/DNA gyrase inhibitor GyrI